MLISRTGAAFCVLTLLSPVLLAAATVWAADATRVTDDHLTPYDVADLAVAQSLTGKPGDPAAGKTIMADRRLGNCLACHMAPIAEQTDQGSIGPDLAHVATRLTEGQLRLRLVNPKLVNPATAMPAFYRVDGLIQVASGSAGKPILSAEQVEDVLAYLETLR
jgi:sulfur-oxidizing protein SoxX